MSELNKSKVSKAQCLKVKKEAGQRAIQILKNIGIFENKLKIQSSDNYLFIPINDKISKSDYKIISDEIQDIEIIEELFLINQKIKNLNEILSKIIPTHLIQKIPKSFDILGDIAIIEIHPTIEMYKYAIGDAILEINNNIKKVLEKSSPITGDYRLRKFNIIAGSGDTETIHKEHGCFFQLNPQKVYFSPRLSFEHLRVSKLVKSDEIIVDMFAGVGPFSIMIAKNNKNVKVYAVDLNPDAYNYLLENIQKNKVQNKIIPILGDIRKKIKEGSFEKADRVIMNLPEKGIEYMDAAFEIIKKGGFIHYYGFEHDPKPLEKAKKKLIERFSTFERKIKKVNYSRIVREIAPKEWQIVLDLMMN